MKKLTVIFLCMFMMLAALSGCRAEAAQSEDAPDSTDSGQVQTNPPDTSEPKTDPHKTSKPSGRIDERLLGVWRYRNQTTERWYYFYEDGRMKYWDYIRGREYECDYSVSEGKIHCTILGYHSLSFPDYDRVSWEPQGYDAVMEYERGTDDKGEYLRIRALNRQDKDDTYYSLEGADKFVWIDNSLDR